MQNQLGITLESAGDELIKEADDMAQINSDENTVTTSTCSNSANDDTPLLASNNYDDSQPNDNTLHLSASS